MRMRPIPLPLSALRGVGGKIVDLQEKFWGVYETLRLGSKEGGVWKPGQTFVAIWRYLGEHLDVDWGEQYAKLDATEGENTQWERAELLPRVTESMPAEVLHGKLQEAYPNGEWFQLQFFRPNAKNVTLPASEPILIYVEEAENELVKKNAQITDFALIQHREKQEAERRARAYESRLEQIEADREAKREREYRIAQEDAKAAQEKVGTMENNLTTGLLNLFERMIPQQGQVSREEMRAMIETAVGKVRDDDDMVQGYYDPGYPPPPWMQQNNANDKLAEAIDKMGQRQMDAMRQQMEMMFRLFEMQSSGRNTNPDPWTQNPIVAKIIDKAMDKMMDGGGGQGNDPLMHPIFGAFLKQMFERGLNPPPAAHHDNSIWGQIAHGVTSAAAPHIQKMVAAGGTQTEQFQKQLQGQQDPPALPPSQPQQQIQPPPPVQIPTATQTQQQPTPQQPQTQPPTGQAMPEQTQSPQQVSMLDLIETALQKNVTPEEFATRLPNEVIDEVAAVFKLSRQELASRLGNLWSLARTQPTCGAKTRSLAGKKWIEETAKHLRSRLET